MNRAEATACLVLGVFGVVLAGGCRKRGDALGAVEYLLPQLRSESVQSIELTSAEGSSILRRRGGIWWVDAPVDYPADARAIEALLRNLADAEVGKKIQAAPADLRELGLDEGGKGISIRLRFGPNRETKLIFGNLDYPDDKSAAGVIGLGFTARRFIRVIDDRSGVFLVPLSLVDLSAAPLIWTDATFIRIPSFRRLRIESRGIATHEVFREYPFGPLFMRKVDGEIGKADPNFVAGFEAFLKQGQCARIGNAGASREELGHARPGSLVVEDFLGISYTFHFGTPQAPNQTEIDRAAMQAGFTNSGVAPTVVPFVIEASVVDADLDRLRQWLKETNLVMVRRLAGRAAYMDSAALGEILGLLEEAK